MPDYNQGDVVMLQDLEPDHAAAMLAERMQAIPMGQQMSFAQRFTAATSARNMHALARTFVELAPQLGLVCGLAAPASSIAVVTS